MKRILTLSFLLIATHTFSQTDKHGNPVFNSVTTNEEAIQDFNFVSNYYSLKTNIENKNSSVYISDNPTLDDIEGAAVNLPSDFFLITKKQAIVNMVMIQNKPARVYFVVNPESGKQKVYPCLIKGDICENRANEIMKEHYDPKAKIDGQELYFNNHRLAIISNNEIRKAILKLIDEEKLSNGESSNLKILSKEETKNIIFTESKVGGKLDFFTEIQGHEYDGLQIKPGVFATKLSIALYKWGRANFDLGVNTVEDALAYWAEFKGREANQREKDYIKMGFNKQLEK